MTYAWPCLTSDIPGIPAAMKRHIGDFQVDELPLYEPCGTGDHVYAWVEKTGLTTRQAVVTLARALGVEPSRIGAAGRKDARGITRQMLSVEGVDPARVRSLALPGIRVLDVARHRGKLRLGSLRGNRFTLRLRDVPAGRADAVRTVLDLLARRGAPNYFGPQRFGMRGDTGEVGRLLLAGDFAGAAGLVVGRPDPADPPVVRHARELASGGKYRDAADAWPTDYADCARVCRLLARAQGDARRAMLALDRSVLRFYVSAYQAWLFNRVVAARLGSLDGLLPGDIVYSHTTGLCSRVTDLATEQARATRFECSATGPIVGFAMPAPEDAAEAAERRILTEAGCRPADLPRSGPLTCVGDRRPLRFPLAEIQVGSGQDETGPYVHLGFCLPPGCYATVVLREICKDHLAEGARGSDDEE